jgi:hypothetical protein
LTGISRGGPYPYFFIYKKDMYNYKATNPKGKDRDTSKKAT